MAWEIDVWGRIRRATEASLANLYLTEDVQRGVMLSLITDVAQAYFELRELDLELEIANRTRDSFQNTLDLFTRQFTGGVGTRLATARAGRRSREHGGDDPGSRAPDRGGKKTRSASCSGARRGTSRVERR
jgi:outer membrane protein TolC